MVHTVKTANGELVNFQFTVPKMFLALKNCGLELSDLGDQNSIMAFVFEYITQALPQNLPGRADFIETLTEAQLQTVIEVAQKSIANKTDFFSRIAGAGAAQATQPEAQNSK
jgi:hypothetical protein